MLFFFQDIHTLETIKFNLKLSILQNPFPNKVEGVEHILSVIFVNPTKLKKERKKETNHIIDSWWH